MLQNTLIQILKRDIERLKKEIADYPSEEDLWKVSGAINNSAGNLCLHLTGNLHHFIGAVLGGSKFVRDREHEFTASGIPREKLIANIDAMSEAVFGTIERLNDDDFAAAFPVDVFGYQMTTEFFLIHLATHLNYHLGQINYHRRLLT